MIRGIWGMIEVYCGDTKRHDGNQKLEVVPGVFNGYFYNCPKYREDARVQGEKKCCNRISPVEYEKMIEYISKKIEEAELNNEKVYLAGHKWKQHGVQFEIFEHTDQVIKVYMLNPKEVK